MGEGKTENKGLSQARARLIYFGMFMTLLTGFVYPTVKQFRPELLETEHDHEMIHDEALKVALEFPSEVMKKYRADSVALYRENKKLKGQIYILKKEVDGLLAILDAIDYTHLLGPLFTPLSGDVYARR